ncbi:MAG: HPr(Ser) kinase/phosphatase [Candidatus Aminicenantes bacterium]|nr:HPr(Ser) kinase/phosphatase [Candidatus Aminicenantes bacterium]
MNSDKDSLIEVKDFFQNTKDFLKLVPVSGKVGFSRKTALSFLKKDRLPIRIWGKKNLDGLGSLSSPERKRFMKRKLGDETFCVILSGGLRFFPGIIEEARKKGVPLFETELSQRICREEVKRFVSSLDVQQVKISAGLLQISSLGVLIMGDSGIGKSESTLELISRGYRFICDDVVLIQKKANDKLVGSAPPLTRNFMEIRGLGIINIKEIFGPKSVMKQSRIDLVIRLKKLQKKRKEHDRLGLEFPEDHDILGVNIPLINIPVAPGRNIATLIEVACKVHLLKKKGYLASQDIVKKLDRVLSIQRM